MAERAREQALGISDFGIRIWNWKGIVGIGHFGFLNTECGLGIAALK